MLPKLPPERTAYTIWPVIMSTTKSRTLPTVVPPVPVTFTVPSVPRTKMGLLIAGAVEAPVAGMVRPLEAQYWSTDENGLLLLLLPDAEGVPVAEAEAEEPLLLELEELPLPSMVWSNFGALLKALALTERTMVTGPEAEGVPAPAEPVPEELLLLPLAEGVPVLVIEPEVPEELLPVPEELLPLAEGVPVLVIEPVEPEELLPLAEGVPVLAAELPVPVALLDEPVPVAPAVPEEPELLLEGFT